MKIAVLSDIHDNIWKLEKALVNCKEADAIVFCGDFCAPFTLKQLVECTEKPVHIVFGNNDGDRFLLTKIATGFPNAELHGEFANLQLGDLKIAVNHYPDIAYEIARNDTFDVVFYGHDHKLNITKVNNTDLINPGEIMGRFGKSTFVVFDTETRASEIVAV